MRAFWNLVGATRYAWFYFVLAVVSWGQITSPTPVPVIQDANPISSDQRISVADQNQHSHTPRVGSETPVITIVGLCASKTVTKVQDSDCKTVITQAQFERVIDTGPTMSARARREFAERYADALVMARKAEELGM